MRIIGQKQALHYLQQGLNQKHLSPSLLFAGPDGIGKRTIAFELSKALVCTKPIKKPTKSELSGCGSCDSCLKVKNRTHPDLLFIDKEFQASLVKGKPQSQSTVKIESVRYLQKFSIFVPLESTKRIIIIDDAHTLTIEAANAMLKILEEPNKAVQLILLARDERNLPSTILSRCATLRFSPLPLNDLSDWLQQNAKMSQEKALKIAEQSHGSLSRALALSEEDEEGIELEDYELDEFFKMLSGSAFRVDSRKKTEKVLNQLIDLAQQKLNKGDFEQKKSINLLLQARKQIDRYVSPRLVLENLYVSLHTK